MIYFIIPYPEVTDPMVAEAVENSRETLRHTISGTDKVILKVLGTPSSNFDGYTQYNHEEILTILTGQEWEDPLR